MPMATSPMPSACGRSRGVTEAESNVLATTPKFQRVESTVRCHGKAIVSSVAGW
jgi:hypothetical protein